MVKMVVGVDGRTLSPYFGRSKQFLVFDVENGKIVKEQMFENPGHTLISSPPKFVAKLGVNVVIGGIIGRIAYSIMRKRGIEVIAGVSGDAVTAVEKYNKGTLVTDESAIETHAPS
ncbi:MAG: NifB/NifX family molybdenum-iron cluster-binding protein [Eubacteriales bacterium]|jgi:predicted Fe-Mo cluster-binding NifX family protein|nr:NifB/NifX family molybdenum-iron cluster-binding protein [Eubacteriales bacterium]